MYYSNECIKGALNVLMPTLLSLNALAEASNGSIVTNFKQWKVWIKQRVIMIKLILVYISQNK